MFSDGKQKDQTLQNLNRLTGSVHILLLVQEELGQVSPNLSTEPSLLNETRSSEKVLGQIQT